MERKEHKQPMDTPEMQRMRVLPIVENRACHACGRELVVAAEMEALADSRVKDALNIRTLLRWLPYQAGASYTYMQCTDATCDEIAPIVSISGPQVQRVLTCACSAVESVPPALRMVRSQYREVVSKRFGSSFGLSLLCKLPSAMVAWENSALVGVSEVNGDVVFDDGHEYLVSFMRVATMLGKFSTGRAVLTESQVISGFTHLLMVKSEYRALAAVRSGASVTVADFFKIIPAEWIDWPTLLVMYVQQNELGEMTLTRVPGVPVYTHMREFVANVQVSLQPIVEGSVVTRNHLCVQIMPDASERDRALTRGARQATVVLHDGPAFIPSDSVVLHGYNKVVVFEPGISVILGDGTRLFGNKAGVALFVNGSVNVTLKPPNLFPDDGYPAAYHPCGAKDFRVHVIVESYARDSSLGDWYSRRFDPYSTLARFMVQTASLVILSSENTSGEPVLSDVPEVITPIHSSDQRYYTEQRVVNVGVGDGRRACSRRHVVFQRSDADTRRVLVADSVEPASGSKIGSLVPLWFTIEGIGDPSLFFGCETSRVSCTTPVSEYGGFPYVLTYGASIHHIDDASSDGFDGHSFDDTRTYGAEGPAFEYLLQYAAGDVQSYGYDRLAKHRHTLLHEIGPRATISEVLSAPAAFYDMGQIAATGIIMSQYSEANIVDLEVADFSWRHIVNVARSWGTCHSVSTFRHQSLYNELCDMYPIAPDDLVLVPGCRFSK